MKGQWFCMFWYVLDCISSGARTGFICQPTFSTRRLWTKILMNFWPESFAPTRSELQKALSLKLKFRRQRIFVDTPCARSLGGVYRTHIQRFVLHQNCQWLQWSRTLQDLNGSRVAWAEGPQLLLIKINSIGSPTFVYEQANHTSNREQAIDPGWLWQLSHHNRFQGLSWVDA